MNVRRGKGSHLAETRQAMHVQRNVEARSRNHCCRGKAISIIQFCVCVRARARAWVGAWACAYACIALQIQHETRRHIVTCGLSGSTKFFDIIKGTIFAKKLLNVKCVF